MKVVVQDRLRLLLVVMAKLEERLALLPREGEAAVGLNWEDGTLYIGTAGGARISVTFQHKGVSISMLAPPPCKPPDTHAHLNLDLPLAEGNPDADAATVAGIAFNLFAWGEMHEPGVVDQLAEVVS